MVWTIRVTYYSLTEIKFHKNEIENPQRGGRAAE